MPRTRYNKEVRPRDENWEIADLAGWRRRGREWIAPNGDAHPDLPDFVNNLNAAYSLVAHIPQVTIMHGVGNRWMVQLTVNVQDGLDVFYGIDVSLAKAICLAWKETL